MMLMFFNVQPAAMAESKEAPVQPSISISVSYGEPGKDGRLETWVTVLCDQGDSSENTAKNVTLSIQGHERIQFLGMDAPYEIQPNPDNLFLLDLHDMASGSAHIISFRIEYQYKSSKGGQIIRQQLDENGEIVRPWMKIIAESANYGSCVYSCDLDIESKPRALCVGWDTHNNTPAIETDVDMLKDTFDQCFLNGIPVDTEKIYNVEFDDFAEYLLGLDTDENDITYIYVNAHGVSDLINHFFANHTGYRTMLGGEEIEADIVSYNELIENISKIKGRLVILLEICFSGNAIPPAKQYLDLEKHVVVTSVNTWMYSGAFSSYGWFANDLVNIAGMSGYPAWDSIMRDTIMKTLTGIVDPALSIFNSIAKLTSLFPQKEAITASDIYQQESKRAVEITLTKLQGIIPIFNYSLLNKEGAVQLITTGLSPHIYGNGDLPVFIRNAEYDNGEVIIVVKNESCTVYPPEEKLSVVFSFDEPSEWAGRVDMYMLSSDGHLIAENSENPEEWKYRSRLTTYSFGYRPAPLDDSGGISTHLYAERLSNNLVLVQMDAGVVAMGPNDPHCLTHYTIYRLDPVDGLQKELFGIREGWYPDHSGETEAYEINCSLNDEKCDQEALFKAFGEYGIRFRNDRICIEDRGKPWYQIVPHAYSEEGIAVLDDIYTTVDSELPKTYEQLVAEYGIK